MTEKDKVEESITDMLRTVADPELPVNIYELGLIYSINLSYIEKDLYNVEIVMTVTAPNCPAIETMPQEVKDKLESLEKIKECKVIVTFDPPWDMRMMSEAARLELGFL